MIDKPPRYKSVIHPMKISCSYKSKDKTQWKEYITNVKTHKKPTEIGPWEKKIFYKDFPNLWI